MDAYTEQRLQEISSKGYELRFDEIFGIGFTIWKRVALPIAGIILLLILIFGSVYGLASSWIYGASWEEILEMMKENPQAFQKSTQSLEFMLRLMAVILPLSVLATPIAPGLLRMCYEADFMGGTRFGTAFYYYKPRYWGRILVISLVALLVGSVPGLFAGQLGAIGSFINMFWSISVHVFMLFAVPLVIFAEASPFEALKASFKLGAKGFFPLLGFSLIGILVASLGIFVCCVGLLFSISYVYVINYLAYRQAIGFENHLTSGEEPATLTENI